jgi:transposase-like protein
VRAGPAKIRRSVIAAARKGEASVAQVTRDLGVSESCVQRWLKIADAVARRSTVSTVVLSDRSIQSRSTASSEP